MGAIVHFEIHADDPQRAITFYEKLFGWSITKWDNPSMDYWLIATQSKEEAAASPMPGINGGLLKRHSAPPPADSPIVSYVCTAGVSSVDDTLKLAVELGGQVAMPKMPIPGMGWLAYLKDTESNTFGIMEPDSNAA